MVIYTRVLMLCISLFVVRGYVEAADVCLIFDDNRFQNPLSVSCRLFSASGNKAISGEWVMSNINDISYYEKNKQIFRGVDAGDYWLIVGGRNVYFSQHISVSDVDSQTVDVPFWEKGSGAIKLIVTKNDLLRLVENHSSHIDEIAEVDFRLIGNSLYKDDKRILYDYYVDFVFDEIPDSDLFVANIDYVPVGKVLKLKASIDRNGKVDYYEQNITVEENDMNRGFIRVGG